MPRAKLPPTIRKVNLTVRLPPALLALVRERGKPATIVRKALEAFLAR